MYHIMLCEDEKAYTEYMEDVILKAGLSKEQVKFYEFTDGETFVDYLKKTDVDCDLLILDMMLPGISGDVVAEQFRRRFPSAVLVFCSGVARPTDRSFKVMAYRYLYKEYQPEKMLQEMREVIDKMISQKKAPTVAVHSYHRQFSLKLEEILYIELKKRGSKVTICPNVDVGELSGELLTEGKLNEVYEKLKEYGFAYAHNSYIVNLRYVKDISYNELTFARFKGEETGQKLSVARSKEKSLREAYAKWIGSKY